MTIDRDHPSLSEDRPLFVDNRGGNTLDRALARHLAALHDESALPWGLDIATAFFNVQGFGLLADQLDRVGRIRLLLGAEPVPEARTEPRKPGEPPEPEFTRRMVAEGLRDLDRGLTRERDLLPFDEDADRAVRRLLKCLHEGKVDVRRYTRQFLHAKAFLFRTLGGGLISGSSNLTYAGLRANRELNLGQYEDPVVERVEGWFDELWAEAEPYDLAALYDRLMAEFPPYLIYLRVLFELYGAELEEEEREVGHIPVTTFQKHGIWRALRILKDFGGVVIADGVGLGKTFTAGEIIRLYRERRQRVLLICPAALRDSTWKEFQDRFDLRVTCVSYEELANDRTFGGTSDSLGDYVDEFQLVVIDEAHNYRNPDSPMRAGILRRLLLGKRRDLLMLTATPVNNKLWDLYHLLRFFVKQDATFANKGVLSLRDRFQEAEAEDPFELNPDLLFPVIDATTVKRTRKFIQRHYSDDLITLPSGETRPIRFPKPVASSIKYQLDAVLPGFIDELEEALGPESGDPLLKMARYQPDRYRLESVDEEEERKYRALVGLLRSGLLKRFESSVYAFARTTTKMIQEHRLFLRGLDEGVVMRKEILHELSAADDDDLMEEMLSDSEDKEPIELFDEGQLRADVRADLALLEALHRSASQVSADADPKLDALLDELHRIADQAAGEAIDADDLRNKQKTLVFSAYADTIDWIESHLSRAIGTDRRLRVYHGRVASVAGSDSRGGVTRDDAVRGFAPQSSGGRGEHADRFDLLLSTDVLAEGMNLQQCRNIINYDLPWNPMRLVQRHGRIDRINSKHSRVFLRTFFPDKDLDRLLKLEHRVRRKLAQAAASVGVETAPIEYGAERDASFAEARDEMEKLVKGDPTLYEEGGTAGAAQTGEEYRQELRRAMERMGGEILNLPWKAGSGMVKGDRRGHLFCAKVSDRVYLRFVPSGDGSIVQEVGTCLRMIECAEATPRVVPIDLRQTAFGAWQAARRSIFEAWTFETDPKNLQPKVGRFNRTLAQYLRDNPPPQVERASLERCLEAIEAPCPVREQRALREVFDRDFANPTARSLAIVREVERLGLEPFQSPEPLPPIDPEQVHLVCWMAISPHEGTVAR